MSIERVLQAVAANRSLWVELECPDVLAPVVGGMSPTTDPHHCTVAFFGKSFQRVSDVVAIVRILAARRASIEARVGGLARFRGNEEEGDPIVWLLSDPIVRHMHVELAHHFDLKRDWDYTPHVTLGRVPRTHPIVFWTTETKSITFRSMAICAGEERMIIPFTEPS